MLKENQYVQVKWNSSNKKHLISQGYIFTKMYDTITIKAEDLSNGSKVKVICLCDYCGQEIIKPYYYHITRGDCCSQCRYLKVKENNLKKYGVESTSQLQSVKDKTKQTNLSKYGCTCTVHNAIIQEKVKQTNIEKYGNEYYFGSEQGKLDIQNIIDNRTQEEKDIFINEYNTMYDTLKPEKVFIYGKQFDGLQGDIERIKTFTESRFKKG